MCVKPSELEKQIKHIQKGKGLQTLIIVKTSTNHENQQKP